MNDLDTADLAGSINHLRGGVDTNDRGTGPTLGEPRREVARPAAKVHDHPWSDRADVSDQVAKRAGSFRPTRKVALRIPHRALASISLDVKVSHGRRRTILMSR